MLHPEHSWVPITALNMFITDQTSGTWAYSGDRWCSGGGPGPGEHLASRSGSVWRRIFVVCHTAVESSHGCGAFIDDRLVIGSSLLMDLSVCGILILKNKFFSRVVLIHFFVSPAYSIFACWFKVLSQSFNKYSNICNVTSWSKVMHSKKWSETSTLCLWFY